MRGLKDYYVIRTLERTFGKNIEYITEEDIATLRMVNIKSDETDKIIKFQSNSDLQILCGMAENAVIEIEGFDLSYMQINFRKNLFKVTLRRCIITDFVINMIGEDLVGFELVLDRVKVEGSIDISKQFNMCTSLNITGKTEISLTRDDSIENIVNGLKEKYPRYMELKEEEKIEILKQEELLKPYLSILNIDGITNNILLQALHIQNMDVEAICMENTKFLDVTFENCILHKFGVDKQKTSRQKKETNRLGANSLSIISCKIMDKDILESITGVKNIKVVNTLGLDIAKTNNPKNVLELEIDGQDINLKDLVHFKKLQTLVILNSKITDAAFIKKFKKLHRFEVSKGSIAENIDEILDRLGKLEYIQVEASICPDNENKV